MLPYWTIAQSLSMVMFAFSLYELLIWIRARAYRVHCSLALLFALMGFYDIFVSRAYAADSSAASIVWLKLLSATDNMVAIAFLWFFSEYGGKFGEKVGAKTFALFALAFTAIAVLEFAAPGEFAWAASRPVVITAGIPLFGRTVFRQVASGPLAFLASLVGIAYVAYCLLAIKRMATKGRGREARGFRYVILAVFAAILNDTAVGAGLYRFIYLTEYTWALSLIFITYSLSSEIIESAEAKEKLALSLSNLHEADVALKESQARWAALIENVPLCVWMCDREGRLIMQNAADIAAVGDHVGSVYEEWEEGPEIRRLFGNINRKALRGEVVDETLSFEVAGEKRYYHDIISPAISDGEVIGSVGIGIDLTGQKAAESRVQRLSRAVEQGPAIVVITDTAGSIEYVSPSFEASTGYASSEVLGKNPRLLKSGHTSDAEYKALWDAISSGRDWHGEFLNRRKDGGLYWETASISPIADEAGRVTHYVAVKQDITARKEQEEKLKASLAEKEVLLREVHHRVKNNLQVVSSLLNINGAGVSDPVAKEAFAASQGQVRAISLAHEALYLSESVAEIDMPTYLRSIAREISRSRSGEGAEVDVDADPVPLGIDKAVPCGLLVNELVTNAFKHAFPGGRGGRIGVELKRLGDGLARLTVEDDGVGFGDALPFGSTTTMGMRLAASLAGQVGGSLRLEDADRTRITIEFPI
jgi:two-component system, sensor histidine kinase PdtaS